METFNFPFHKFSEQYPEEPVAKAFGGGWTYAPTNPIPIRRTFILKFKGMQYFQNLNGTIDISTSPEKNMGTLRKFYEDHRFSERFVYPSELYGDIIVRFVQKLDIPETEGTNGILGDFEIRLEEAG